MNVGVIGIGAFGSRVALRLLWNGYHALQLYDVNDISTRQFTNDYGGLATGSPKMMAQACEAIITVLPSAAELREVCFGWENLTGGFGDSGTVINLGICDPIEIAAIARKLAERGVALLDAPAFGTPAEAKEGKLALLVGGDERAFARARPILETLAHKVERVGEAGAPQALGAIADYLHGAKLLAASEALRIGERFGLDPDYVLRGREEGARADLGGLLRQQVLPRRFASGVSLGMIHRNVAIASKLASTNRLASPMLEATRAAWAEAEATLGSGADHTAIIRWLERLQPTAEQAECERPEPPAT
ncbi:MAG TPA: NAD(P)-dependent oxidoreductase [Xanthobacteraceae bacterium]|jgi:3-hydroxyisobutyrate dehydrogenase